MRLGVFASAAVAAVFIFGSTPASAQEWFEYVNKEDRWAANLPAEPRVEEFIYVTEYGSRRPARRYIAEDGRGGTYMMTVVDMTETDRGPGRHGTELRGSIMYEANQQRKTGEVTLEHYQEMNVIPGYHMQIKLPDGRQKYVAIHLHHRYLYIAEGIVPANSPPPGLFQQSLVFLDLEGNPVRYVDDDYSFPDGRPTVDRGN